MALYNRVIYNIPIEHATVSTLVPFQGQGRHTFGQKQNSLAVCQYVFPSCFVPALKKHARCGHLFVPIAHLILSNAE